MTIRVVVADDQALVRSRFSVLLAGEPDIDVVGEANNGAEAVALAASERPDVMLMDVRLATLRSQSAASSCRRLAPGCPSQRHDADGTVHMNTTGFGGVGAAHRVATVELLSSAP
jgi:DNA-binding NarL/FixJ family response regulator